MNSQVSLTSEEKKDTLSTPKFHINKSFISNEREENNLDTVKQNINSLLNVYKSTNLEKTNEYQNVETNKNFALTSLVSNTDNKNDLNNYYSNQFSFDEKSQNYIFSKNENDNKENIDNNIIIISENEKNQEDNNEIKYINNLDTLLTDSNKKYSNENTDNNFNYILPLESDKSSEQFNLISFQGYSEEIEDNQNINFKNIPNQKKMAGDQKLFNNPEILNKKIGIGYLSKQKEKTHKKVLKDELKLTPKKNKNNIINEDHPKNVDKYKNKIKKIISSSNHISHRKNRSFNLKIPSLIEDYKNNICLTEPNNISIEYKKLNNSQKNTFFTSNRNILIITPKKENKNINPFLIIKSNSNNHNNKSIKKDIIKNELIKDIIMFKKKNNLKSRNSVNNLQRSNKFVDNNDKNMLIYEKNFDDKENRSFSINNNNNEKNKVIHSRNNSSQINQKNYTYDNEKIKKCIILFSQKDLKSSTFQTRNNSFKKNNIISSSDGSTKRTIKKIKEGKFTPFFKSKISDLSINKNALSKKFIFTQSSSVQNRKPKININKSREKYEENQIFISSSNKDVNNKFTVFCNYDSKKIKKNIEKTFKDKIKSIEIKKIKVNTINNNTLKNNKFHLNNTCYMNYKKNKPKLEIEKNNGNLTERNRESIIGPSNIYSKKLVLPTNNNSITNIYSSMNNESINCCKIKKKNKNNKSFVMNKENKNSSISEYSNSNNSLIVKDKIKFHKYFSHILSKIDLNKNIINKKININNKKKSNKQKSINNSSNINSSCQEEKNIFAYSTNSFNPRIKYNNKDLKNKIKVKEYNTNNKSIHLVSNNKFHSNKINKKKEKISFENGKTINIPNFKKNIVKYSILRNNENNQISNEISIYIGKQKNNSQCNLDIYNSEYIKNEKEKYSLKNKQFKTINVNKKTIINVNQFYPSYFINNNENIVKNKNNITSYI